MTSPHAPDLLAFVSGKGGTGKSTAAVAVAHALARDYGLRVALVDLDPQAGATDYVGAEPADAPLLAPPVPLEGLAGVQLYRGGRALALADAGAIGARLHHIATVPTDGGPLPDVLVVDLAPALHDAAHRAILAHPAARLVLAVRLDGGGIRAARELVGMADAAGRLYAIAPTFANARRALSAAMERTLREFYGGAVLRAVVPDDAKAAEAATIGAPVTAYAPRSKAAAALVAQTGELAERFALAEHVPPPPRSARARR